MNSDITETVKKCEACNTYKYQQQKEPLIEHEVPEGPWIKLGADLFHFKNKNYLLVADYYSNFSEIAVLKDTTAKQVIKKMKVIFSRHGLPQILMTDNRSQFGCREFQKFSKDYEFEHITSSPRFPQSNGFAEKHVQIIKRILKKTEKNNEDLCLALLAYRSSPLENGLSPAEMIFSRRIRSRLPDMREQKFKKPRKKDNKKFYDLGSKQLPTLNEKEIVRIRNDDNQKWEEKAMVMKQTGSSSYDVLTQSGNRLRRNRRHLLQTKDQFTEKDDDKEDDSHEMISDKSKPDRMCWITQTNHFLRQHREIMLVNPMKLMFV